MLHVFTFLNFLKLYFGGNMIAPLGQSINEIPIDVSGSFANTIPFVTFASYILSPINFHVFLFRTRWIMMSLKNVPATTSTIPCECFAGMFIFT
ncbi:hypothetical protein NY2A_b386L [Paramecium bursaria Chlorella virus NY2A]|uniref:Uncharacterized protein b386L n=1 Tax=Paramecium bursaria Chlorella virus NY2A TaxID=46021 RepID=A7IWR1_PBCVN|nr:hypothetical protein NY2A_b386L [Paramecium bursaria Chlorella virus NY2A]YP_001498416.1 hypothetical protein AR158_c335L [Paramecium bursaria Chlorella virus AR158]ABT14785.1 hypothetical protein NY2A_b386L [Paramecium bursaria Chlorella virus NY2A]ABU43880.1 hypothetical protein AR158_c335L [Paramecium bursaria Chlorella virus AR158]